MKKDTEKTVIFIPTYNELENVPRLFHELLSLGLDTDIVFIDDNSPDGTGALLDELAKTNPRLHVIHRPGKLGIGSAHLDAIKWAYANGYVHVVTMDCDFTHPPAYIPKLLDAAKGFDIAIGSRYLRRTSLEDWNPFRKTLTRLGHLLTTTLLGMPYDATSGFRYYRLSGIPSDTFDLIRSSGYSFFYESLFILHLNKFSIAEIPIHLPSRTYGHSKMDQREIRNSVRFLATLSLTAMLNREKMLVADPVDLKNIAPELQDDQGWDEYWNKQTNAGGLAYDAAAAFYRKFIIKRTLNYFVRRYFTPGAAVLHAGCGSGQVDTDIRRVVRITGLDISANALRFYKQTNQNECAVLHGSIFNIPLPNNVVDGIYNLGVMEHFTEEEISKILAEFRRVLRPGGRMIIFWPPEFGASVIFFKILKTFCAQVLGRTDVKFHPDEITRVRSREHVTRIFEKSQFRVERYYFGPKDLFTYAVIVAEKPSGETQQSEPPCIATAESADEAVRVGVFATPKDWPYTEKTPSSAPSAHGSNRSVLQSRQASGE